ncbi:unnamed protein product [Porites lobata]|uniref:Gamma-amino-N-butyrate transaminase n=1 Tax=Porites lobata TaxID=104759 RepID=A0ABN8P7C5_9CNID|nr:unnamed protein product [Porites lobata]
MIKNVQGIKLAKTVGHGVVVKPFPGATIRDMRSYVVPAIDKSPDQIFLHVGTNDLKSSTQSDVADAIIDLAREVENASQSEIIISELTARNDDYCDALKASKHRGDPEPRIEDLDSCMLNQAPGTPPLSILGFDKGFHGRTLGALSTTRSKAIARVDIPVFDWPKAPFPYLQYPLEENQRANRAEEERCLELARQAIINSNNAGKPVAAIIVEPIQSEGGDNHASVEFFKSLQQIAKELDALFIVDEVQTGCGSTGKFWAHEHWGLDDPPDIVTFSKKMMIGGFYHKPEVRVQQPSRIFNTWMGDQSKLVLLKAVVEVIQEEGLLQRVQESGRVLLSGLENIQDKHPRLFSRSRGVGTFCAIDCADEGTRAEFISRMKANGVELGGGCGAVSIRFRPTLTFLPRHADILLEIMDKVASEMKS